MRLSAAGYPLAAESAAMLARIGREATESPARVSGPQSLRAAQRGAQRRAALLQGGPVPPLPSVDLGSLYGAFACA